MPYPSVKGFDKRYIEDHREQLAKLVKVEDINQPQSQATATASVVCQKSKPPAPTM